MRLVQFVFLTTTALTQDGIWLKGLIGMYQKTDHMQASTDVDIDGDAQNLLPPLSAYIAAYPPWLIIGCQTARIHWWHDKGLQFSCFGHDDV